MADDEALELNETEKWVYEQLLLGGYKPGKWLRPMDIGRPSHFITRGLRGLIRKGLAESRRRQGSTAKLYRLKVPHDG